MSEHFVGSYAKKEAGHSPLAQLLWQFLCPFPRAAEDDAGAKDEVGGHCGAVAHGTTLCRRVVDIRIRPSSAAAQFQDAYCETDEMVALCPAFKLHYNIG